ncbi:MAG TPA: hypothetical protein VEY11_06650 [Pyrinomonadaceae bacterium]|nr:hypothetical protein [Pyrinomonadaceae bacterium]
MTKRDHGAADSSSSGDGVRTSRRQFAKTAAGALVAAPLVASATLNAQTPPATRQAPAPPTTLPTPQAATQPSPVAVAYAEIARLRFGAKLSPEDLTRMTRDMEGNVRTAERLRAFKLKNADEPDFIFIA